MGHNSVILSWGRQSGTPVDFAMLGSVCLHVSFWDLLRGLIPLIIRFCILSTIQADHDDDLDHLEESGMEEKHFAEQAFLGSTSGQVLPQSSAVINPVCTLSHPGLSSDTALLVHKAQVELRRCGKHISLQKSKTVRREQDLALLKFSQGARVVKSCDHRNSKPTPKTYKPNNLNTGCKGCEVLRPPNPPKPHPTSIPT